MPTETEQLREELREKEQILQELLQEIAELRGLAPSSPSTGDSAGTTPSVTADTPPAEAPSRDTLLKNLQISSRELKKNKRRRKKLLKILKDSGMVYSSWYLQQYPDVAATGAEPAEHYLLYGAAEGRNPSPDFDTCFYLQSSPDVAASGDNPLIHFIRFGKEEGRQTMGYDPSRKFI